MKIQSTSFKIEVSGATLTEIAELETKGFNISEIERSQDMGDVRGGGSKKAWKCKAEITGFGSPGSLKPALDFIEEAKKL
ncbi:MAG: hypothetical protein QG620_809 [Patescibacteria group bacterium]|nr:hypothetical protein [Patescibacteria group bacterium]